MNERHDAAMPRSKYSLAVIAQKATGKLSDSFPSNMVTTIATLAATATMAMTTTMRAFRSKSNNCKRSSCPSVSVCLYLNTRTRGRKRLTQGAMHLYANVSMPWVSNGRSVRHTLPSHLLLLVVVSVPHYPLPLVSPVPCLPSVAGPKQT